MKMTRPFLVAPACLLAFAGLAQCADGTTAAEPSLATFDKVVRATLEERRRSIAARSLAFARDEGEVVACIPKDPAPDGRSKLNHAPAWYFDFTPESLSTKPRESQARQLRALVKTGLLEQSSVLAGPGDRATPMLRFRITDKGWAAMTYGPHASCFIYGSLRYQGLDQFEKRVASGRAGIEMYEVRGKSGVGPIESLPAWARDPEMQAAYPEIKANIAGRPFTMILARGAGDWAELSSELQEQLVRPRNEARPSWYRRSAAPSAEQQRKLDELEKLPPPTVDEIKQVLHATHGADQRPPYPTCLHLPPTSTLPVDRALINTNPTVYSVAIFTNKNRAPYDQVPKTIAYLDRLETLGLMRKQVRQGVSGEGIDAGKTFDAHVYELTPAYVAALAPRIPTCLVLGKPTLEFIDVQVVERQPSGYPYPSFRYKLRILFKDPPAWARDSSLVERWPDLKGALTRGQACEGEFGFDRLTRQKEAGGGSCWWAFESELGP